MRHLKQWVADKEQGKDTMPNFVMLRLPNDHTRERVRASQRRSRRLRIMTWRWGAPWRRFRTRLSGMTRRSSSWKTTRRTERDHVDAHRSYALVISKYAPHGKDGGPVVDSRFYSTVSVVRTMESLLGLPPMNNNDAFSSLISTLFTGPGDQAPYSADYSNRDNGLIYTANTKKAPGAEESMKMDFRHADRADAQKLNVILWKDAMGTTPVPAMLMQRRKKVRKDDDD